MLSDPVQFLEARASNTNPVAKLGCGWIFFQMQTLSMHSQIQVNFANTAFTNHSA